jgi:hypothetical protein
MQYLHEEESQLSTGTLTMEPDQLELVITSILDAIPTTPVVTPEIRSAEENCPRRDCTCNCKTCWSREGDCGNHNSGCHALCGPR